MRTSEKIVVFLVASLFVGCLIFEGGMALAVAHLTPSGKCSVCSTTGGGGGF